MQSVLDVIIDPKGAQAGARAVNQSLTSMQSHAQQAMGQFKTRLDAAKTSVFSLQSAIAVLGAGALARSFVSLGRELDLTERGLRTVTSSAGNAAVQMARLRDIADEFQLPDKDMADAFRLLASNNIPNAEKALRSIANVAASTGIDIGSVTTAMLAGQERMLRQLGVQMVDLGTGEVDLLFGNMEIRAKKTDDAMRAGLLQLFQKGFPDATKTMGTSIDFQIKRMEDVWEDFQAAVMTGGLNQYLATTLKIVADGFNGDDIKRKGQQTAQNIQATLETIARDTAVVLDVIGPFATAAIGILDRAFSGFNKLPPELQTIGIFGAFWFGKKGLLVLTAGLALADKLGIKFDDIAAKANQLTDSGIDMVRMTPLGALAAKGAEALSGKQLPKGLTPPPSASEASSMPSLFGLKERAEGEGKSARQTVDDYIKKIHEDMDTSEKERKAAIATAEANRAAGGTEQTANAGLTANARIVQAQINKLRQDSIELQDKEQIKQDILYSPERLQAYHDGLQTIQALEKSGLSLKDADKEAVMAIFYATGQAMQMTQAWNDALQINSAALDRRNSLMRDSGRAAQDAQLAVDLMSTPEGPARREQELRSKLLLAIDRERIPVGAQQLDYLQSQVREITALEQRERSLLAVEQQRKDHLEKVSQLNDKIRDTQSGQQGPGFTTRLNERQRQAEASQLDFNPVEAGQQISLEMDKERALSLEQVTYQMEQESNAALDQARIAGKSRADREAEARILQTVNDLRREGINLTPEEIQGIRERSRSLQFDKELARSSDAINGFVDSFEVGWVQIANSGQQAYSHLEDALVGFVQTGKLNFGSLISFMEQELIRFAARSAITAGFNAIGGSQGIGSLFSGLFGAGGAPVEGGLLATTAINVVPGQAMGGILPRHSYSGGGVATRPQMALFGEGSRPEAFVPLPDGRTIPVTMQGGSGGATNIAITINADGGQQQQATPNAKPNMTQLARDMSRLVEAKLIEEQRPGGLLAR